MPSSRIRFVGPAALAVKVAIALADADGVDLSSSTSPSPVGDHAVELDMSVEGPLDAIERAVARIGADLPAGASLEITRH